ncbi:hypothetical protein vBCtySFA88_00085 [Clostridium phage vB_CtyS-FA88]|nr:hypothetical protein vBCtySFA88_00085 [Clostridium phage vB_CtyS-FA88]
MIVALIPLDYKDIKVVGVRDSKTGEEYVLI